MDNGVHDLLDERARIAGCVDGQQRTYKLRTCERGLVDVRHHAR
jgi:hypothetical protein